jgi:hypothetical protein
MTIGPQKVNLQPLDETIPTVLPCEYTSCVSQDVLSRMTGTTQKAAITLLSLSITHTLSLSHTLSIYPMSRPLAIALALSLPTAPSLSRCSFELPRYSTRRVRNHAQNKPKKTEILNVQVSVGNSDLIG